MRARALAGLLAAVSVSQLGTRISAVALPWFVLVTTGSPAALRPEWRRMDRERAAVRTGLSDRVARTRRGDRTDSASARHGTPTGSG